MNGNGEKEIGLKFLKALRERVAEKAEQSRRANSTGPKSRHRGAFQSVYTTVLNEIDVMIGEIENGKE